jgi:AcrR family transcriptional regulator
MKKPRRMDPTGKRDAILTASEALFATQGYQRTTMAHIAASAAVAVGTLYRLFPDKPALLAALHAQMEQGFIDAMHKGWESQDSYIDKFDPMIDALIDQAIAQQARMPLYQLTRELVGTTDYVPGARTIDAIKAQYTAGVLAGSFVDQDPEIAAHIAHGMVEGAMRAISRVQGLTTIDAIKQTLKGNFKRSFVRFS